MASISRAAGGKVVALHGGQVMPGGFEAGSRGRRLRAIPTSTLAINSTIRAYGRTAIARSRYLCVNNATAALAKEEFVSSLVGNGIKPSWTIDNAAIKAELQELFLEWTDESDADGLTDFYGQQGIIAGEMYEAGECFVRARPRFISDGLSVPMQLQILPSEMCPFDYNVALGDGARIECGVQFDAIGRRVGYWFYKNHPGELQFNTMSGNFLTFVPADQIYHLFKPIRAGQVRGVPHTLSGIVTLALLDLYDDAELERKRTAALFSAFITRNPNEEEDQNPLGGAPTTDHKDQNGNSTGQNNVGMEPGATVELETGQDVRFAQPADVGANYEAFERRNLLRATAGLGVPYAQGTGDLQGTSYGSQRGGMVTFRRRIERDQNAVMIFQLCRPVVQAWVQAAVLANAFTTFSASDFAAAPRQFTKVRWITPKWDWIDPLKDLSAEKLAVDSGFKPRSDVIEAMGYDAEEVDEQISRDQKRAKRLGLKFVTLSRGLVLSPTDDDEAITSTTGTPDASQDDPNADDPENSDENDDPNPPNKAARNSRKTLIRNRKSRAKNANRKRKDTREIWDR